MEYDNNEMSDCSSNSEYSSFTTNKEEEVTLKKIAELKKKITELENTSIIKKEKKNKQEKKLSNRSHLPNFTKREPLNNKSTNKSQPTIIEDDTEFSSDEPKQESMRLLVAEKLYSLCSTTEYRDMPINEINKCIDKFHKKSPSFPETVGDWAEREMIRRHVNYRRSIINNTRNVCETQETNKSTKTHKANVNRVNINRVKRKRVVCNEIKSNEVDVVIEEDYNDEESQHSEIEKHSKRKSKTRKILNDTTKYHSLQSDNNYEDVETSGQECEAIETDNNVSSAEKCPTSKPQSDNDDEAIIEVSDQESEVKEAKNTSSTSKNPGCKLKVNQPNEEVIEVSDHESEVKEVVKNTTSTTKCGRKPKAKQPNNHDNKGVSSQESEAKEVKNTTSTTKRGHEPKAKQPNNHDNKGVSSQESEAKEVVKNTTSTTKRPGRRPKAKQSNNDNVEATATTGQKHKAKESSKDSPLATRRSARKCKAV
ncbi:hypothetical protein GLOIN_2v1886336 [Rhizophagus clarus]|uniref:Uncharacterized protein n=1 Tax=Rhizophagus clarus TaxID=94130 RepID=A0A8H3LG65_9GLOM|nr:hypothetical protein GLOIN_2v1886336 [Rhizophagus clarus]